MKKNTYLRRHLNEGLNNFKRNGWMTFTSVSSLAFMLFLIGVTFLLLFNLNHMTTKVENNVEIHVYLKDIDSFNRELLVENIQSYEHVSSIEFVSKDEGLKSFMKNLGDEGAAFETLKNENPLNDQLIVKTERPKDVTTVAKRIQKLSQVDKLAYAKNVVASLLTTTKVARLVGTIFIICLTFICVHSVMNMIKVTVLARKEEIQLRKMIGATNLFIRLPFFIEGSVIGLIGASIAGILVGFGYFFVYSFANPRIDQSIFELIAPLPLIPTTCLFMLLLGAFIGIWGAISSLRPVLKV